MLTATALVVSALVPGLVARWSSARLLDRLDDPLLPDLLLAHSRRVGTAAGIVIGLGALLASSFLPAAVFLTWMSVLAGGFRARRAVFDESRSFLSYVGHSLRFWLGLLGSFVLIAWIPWAMGMAGEYALAAGIALGALAYLWVWTAPLVFRSFVRARPFDGPEAEALSPLFSRVLQNAKCARPALFVAEARGGRWVNAFALPAVRRPGVLFTRGFLSALTAEETAAIFAHEVAHLEHFQPKKVVLGRALAFLLVAIPVFLWGGPLSGFLRGCEWIWPLAFFVAMAAKAGKNRGHEAESDRRALELSADPDSLVSGLTKLHTLNRLSRRWDSAYEALSTHPSLARRIRAIRAASGNRPTGELEKLFRAGDGSDRAVLFDAARVHWLRGLPEDGSDPLARSEERRSYRYEDVLDLRLHGRRELVSKDAAGRTERMSVSAEDVARIEEVLDRVDGLLSDAGAVAEAPTARLWALVAGLLSLMPNPSFVVVVLAAVAAARPSRTVLLTLGASGLASAIALPVPWWRSSSLALAGVAVIFVAARKRSVPARRSDVLLAALTPLAFVLLSGLGAAAAIGSSLPAMRLSLWASETPSAFVGLVAIATVLATLPRRRARFLAVLALVAALGLSLIGSSDFRRRFGRDLFVEAGAPMPVRESQLTRIREVTISGGASRLWLSPRGSSFAVALAQRDEAEGALLVETMPGRVQPLRGLDLEYLDEGRILVLERNERGATLKVLAISDLESEGVVRDVPLLAGVDIDADSSGSWQMTGYDWMEGGFVLLRGRLDSEPLEEIRFSNEDEESTVLAVSPAVGALVARYDMPGLPIPGFSGPNLVMALSLERAGGPATSLGESVLSPQCFRRPLPETGFYCAATDGGRTGLFSLPSDSTSFQPLGFVPGALHANEASPGGGLVLNRWDGLPLLVDLEEGAALRPQGFDLRGSILAWRGETLAAARATVEGDETKVSLYTVRR